MKYANLNDERIEPKKGIVNATCPVCGELVTPKCGDIRMHHWAHKINQNCDPWWENETKWHRQWKDCFPKEFQEVIMYDDETGEKHVADIKTQTGFVIEFQHSAMKREEQVSRENFYKNMIWVIDAREYYETFKKHIKILEKNENHRGYFHMTLDCDDLSKSCFPKRWLESSVPVVFDFGLHDRSDEKKDKQKKWLYCLFPEQVLSHETTYCGMYMTKEDFVNRVLNNNSFFPNLEFPELEQKRLERIKALQEEEQKMEEEYRKEKEAIFQEKYSRQKKWRKAIFELSAKIEQNAVNPIKLYVSDKGKLTDYEGKIYNEGKCMVISVKSYPAKYKDKEYTKNEALLLIEQTDRIIFATANLSTYIVDTVIYGYMWGTYDHDPLWNCGIRNIKIEPYYGKFQLSFEYDESLWWTRKIRECLEYIDIKFSNKNLMQ